MKMTMLPETGFIRLVDLLNFFPVSRSSFYDGIKKGKYPAPVKLSERTSAWRVGDVRALIEQMSAA